MLACACLHVLNWPCSDAGNTVSKGDSVAERRARLGAPCLFPLSSISDRQPDAHMEMISPCMHCAADMPL